MNENTAEKPSSPPGVERAGAPVADDELERVREAANGLVAALLTFMPVIEASGIDVNALLELHGNPWRIFTTPRPEEAEHE